MKTRPIRMPAPYLRRVWLDQSRVADAAAYPFCRPLLRGGFELEFERPITILVGENGTGKSTLLEGIAALAGYDDAGGGKGYRPLDHSRAVEAMGGRLAAALRASWLPKITSGWFFKAESFFSVARYLDAAALDFRHPPPDFLSHSATHSPLLMAYPGAQLLRLSSSGLEPTNVQDTDHYRLMREFCSDPAAFIDQVLVS
jgi:predicted ATPase